MEQAQEVHMEQTQEVHMEQAQEVHMEQAAGALGQKQRLRLELCRAAQRDLADECAVALRQLVHECCGQGQDEGRGGQGQDEGQGQRLNFEIRDLNLQADHNNQVDNLDFMTAATHSAIKLATRNDNPAAIRSIWTCLNERACVLASEGESMRIMSEYWVETFVRDAMTCGALRVLEALLDLRMRAVSYYPVEARDYAVDLVADPVVDLVDARLGPVDVDTRYVDTRYVDTRYVDARYVDTRYVDARYVDANAHRDNTTDKVQVNQQQVIWGPQRHFNVNAVSRDGNHSVLYDACRLGLSKAAELLIGAKARMDFGCHTDPFVHPYEDDTYRTWTPMHAAAHHDRPACICVLLKAKADGNAVFLGQQEEEGEEGDEDDGRQPLHIAVVSCSAGAVNALLCGKVQLDVADANGLTPLQLARRNVVGLNTVPSSPAVGLNTVPSLPAVGLPAVDGGICGIGGICGTSAGASADARAGASLCDDVKNAVVGNAVSNAVSDVVGELFDNSKSDEVSDAVSDAVREHLRIKARNKLGKARTILAAMERASAKK
jgi:hypothetical protein